MHHRSRWPGFLLAVLLLLLSMGPSFRSAISIPEQLTVAAGERVQIPVGFPLTIKIQADRSGIIQVNGNLMGEEASTLVAQAISLKPVAAGTVTLELKLFGIIPFRDVTVDVVSPVKVMPGGHSIGVLVQTDGVLVIGHSPVQTVSGKLVYPAKEAGLRVGDTIYRIDGKIVESVSQVAEQVHIAGKQQKAIQMEVRRNGRSFKTSVTPVYDREHHRHLIGLWIRDTSAGVGTLTFYDTETGVFGALGHTVQDLDTGRPLEISRGRIVPANVLEINRGLQGRPGEKIGVFAADAPTLGEIRRNTPHGIIGQLDKKLEHPLFDSPVSVALSSQIQPGPAELITVVDGQRMQRFDILIERVLGNHPGGKNMIIRITDNDLLELTGGIVQGMSGSPILQNGKLVGAVTHVFVNDPTRGYGVFAEWMLRESGLLSYNTEKYPAAG